MDSHFGGATYVGLLRPLFFSTTVTQWPHIFFFNQWLSLKDPLFFLSICHRKPVTFQFQQQIGYFKWFCAQSSLSKVRNSILGISMGLKWFSLKDPKFTYLPNVPIKKMQNAVSYQKTHIFSVLLSPDAPGCENRCPIPISISYYSPQDYAISLCFSFKIDCIPFSSIYVLNIVQDK